MLVDGAAGLESDDQPAILEFAANLADRVRLREEAAQIRREIIDDHPASPEAPGAILAVARELSHGGTHEEEEARVLLERLITEYPRSALVPQARRELDRLPSRPPNP
jgi:hypothetical protein